MHIPNPLKPTVPHLEPSPTYISDKPPLTYDLFPQFDRSCQADDHLCRICEWFGTTECPLGLTNTAYTAFLHYTKYFFQKHGRLWRRDLQGHHKVVIDCNRRPAILMPLMMLPDIMETLPHVHTSSTAYGGLTSLLTSHGLSGPATFVNFAKLIMSSYLW